jgi:hypothetical protein
MAAPSVPDLVQLPQVMSGKGANAVPSGREPVRMSCLLGFIVRSLTGWPFSSSPVSLVRLLLAEAPRRSARSSRPWRCTRDRCRCDRARGRRRYRSAPCPACSGRRARSCRPRPPQRLATGSACPRLRFHQVGALAGAHARNEERHRIPIPRRPGCTAAQHQQRRTQRYMPHRYPPPG